MCRHLRFNRATLDDAWCLSRIRLELQVRGRVVDRTDAADELARIAGAVLVTPELGPELARSCMAHALSLWANCIRRTGTLEELPRSLANLAHMVASLADRLGRRADTCR